MSSSSSGVVPVQPIAGIVRSPLSLALYDIVPAGYQLEPVRCSSCHGVAAIVALPPMPPAPVEVRSLIASVVRFFTRRSPDLRRAADCLIRGELREAVAIARASEELAGVVPVVCRDCLGPRLLEAVDHAK